MSTLLLWVGLVGILLLGLDETLALLNIYKVECLCWKTQKQIIHLWLEVLLSLSLSSPGRRLRDTTRKVE